jgi:hypothetical protein
MAPYLGRMSGRLCKAKVIIINDTSLPIEEDDHILRKLPSNLNEDYVVTQATCYTGQLAHWELKYRKSKSPATTVQTIVNNIVNNISGHNPRVNINSTDNSNNQIVEKFGKKYFLSLQRFCAKM